MQCRNQIYLAVGVPTPCYHTASTELSNGLPVCECCCALIPILDAVREEVDSVLRRALAMGHASGTIQIVRRGARVVTEFTPD